MPRIRRKRDYQAEAIEKIHLSWKGDIQRQLIVLATGLGKTVIACFFHGEILPGQRTLFIVDNVELAKQTKRTMHFIYPDVKVGIEMNRFHASLDDDFVILSVDTWGRSKGKRITRFPNDHFTKVIVDEAHVSPTPRYNRVLHYFGVSEKNLHPDRLLLGMTATPERHDGIGLNKVFDDITVNYDLIWGIQNGWLTELVGYPVDTGIDISNVKMKRNGEFQDEDLSVTINVNKRNEQIVKAYADYSEGKRSLCFTSTVKHAYDMVEVYNSYYPNRSAAISAKTPTEERKEYVEAYHNGEIWMLFNYGTLTKGFDETEIDSIIHGRPIGSETLYRQATGRGARPSRNALVDLAMSKEGRLQAIENSPKKFCKVIDFQDNIGKHSICSLPRMFGLNEKLRAPGKKMYKDVLEPLKEKQREHRIDITKLTALDDVELMIKKRERLSITSLGVPTNIKRHSKNAWNEIGNEIYELAFPKEHVALIVEKNTIERYDLKQINISTGEEEKLNKVGFGSLQGALNIADEYAEANFDLTYHKTNSHWRKKGVTEAQFDKITSIFKPEIRDGDLIIDEKFSYKDTDVPVLYYVENGEKTKLNRHHAWQLLNNFFTQRQMKRSQK